MSKHTPDQWVPIVALPPNPKVPDHYGHISECCGSVLMPPWEYERARHCIEACTGMADPQAEIAVLRDAVRVLGAALLKSERWKYEEMGGNLWRFDEDPVACMDEAIRNNPIAAAAVKGVHP